MLSSKNISKILSLVLVVFLGGVLVAHAYVPLAKLPIGDTATGSTGYESMDTYLAGMMKFLVAIGGVIAIVIAIIGGVQYIASGITPSQKNDAKKRIEDALVGLALVLTSYLILNSINPNLVKLNLNLEQITLERRVPELPPQLTEAQSVAACRKELAVLSYEGIDDPCSGPYNNYSQIGSTIASSTNTLTILYSNNLNRDDCEGRAKATFKERYIGVFMRENNLCSVVIKKIAQHQ